MASRACLTLLSCLALAIPAFGQVELKWQFKTGDKFYQETTTTRKQTIRFMGQETKVDHQFVTVSAFLVAKKSDDGSIHLEQKIESVRPLEESTTEALPHVLQKLKEATFQIHLSPTMQVTKLEGYDDFIKTVGVGNASYERVARSLTSEDVLRRAVEESMGFLKPGQLQKGDQWTRKTDVPLGPLGSVQLARHFQFADAELIDGRELQKLIVSTEATYALPTGEPGILPFRISKGEIKVVASDGTLWFDAAAGRLARSSCNLKLKGSLTVKLMDQDQMVEIEQEQTVKIRVLDRNPGEAPANK